jgi:uncharacterized Zn finger protein (UPF0148 family)
MDPVNKILGTRCKRCGSTNLQREPYENEVYCDDCGHLQNQKKGPKLMKKQEREWDNVIGRF